MNQNRYAHPFLVSRNKVEDYRTIIAPQFLIDKKIAGILRRAVGGEDIEDTVTFEQRIVGVGVEGITLIYRVVRAKKYHILSAEEGLLRDADGRSFRLFFGVILENKESSSLVTNSLLLKVEENVKQLYSKYWQLKSHDWAVATLTPLILEAKNTDLTPVVRKELKVLDPSWQSWRKFKEIPFIRDLLSIKTNSKGRAVSAIEDNQDKNPRLFRLDNIESKKSIPLLPEQRSLYNAYCSVFHPINDLIIYGCNGCITVYNAGKLMEGKLDCLCAIDLPDQSLKVIDISISCGGKDIIAITDNLKYFIFDIESMRLYDLLEDENFKPWTGIFHPNKPEIFVLGAENNRISICKFNDNSRYSSVDVEGISNNSNAHIKQLSFSPNGKFFAGLSSDGSIQIIDTERNRKIYELEGDGTIITSITFSCNSELMVAGEENGDVRIYSTQTWQEVSSPLKNAGNIICCSFESSGKYIYVFTPKHLTVWEKQ